jgi:hypothetical protein
MEKKKERKRNKTTEKDIKFDAKNEEEYVSQSMFTQFSMKQATQK